MVRSIFTIGFNKHQNKLLKLFFEKKGIFCYCHEEVGQFQYLVDDQKPEIILFDGEHILKNWDLITTEISQCSLSANCRKILVSDLSEDFNQEKFTSFFSEKIFYPLNFEILTLRILENKK